MPPEQMQKPHRTNNFSQSLALLLPPRRSFSLLLIPTPTMNVKLLFVALLATLNCCTYAAAECDNCPDWLFAPSNYTHSPVTGQRVAQYAQIEPVEPLDDPRQTVSRYWQTRTQLRGADGSADTIYEVRSFGNTRGGFDAQRERGFDASLQTLDALRPFRHNPYLFFGGLQGFGFGFPGYPGNVPGAPFGPGWTNPHAAQQQIDPATGHVIEGQPGQAVPAVPYGYGPNAYGPSPYAPGAPGTAYPYAPPSTFVAPPFYGYFPPYPGYGYGPGYGGGRRDSGSRQRPDGA